MDCGYSPSLSLHLHHIRTGNFFHSTLAFHIKARKINKVHAAFATVAQRVLHTQAKGHLI